MDPQTEENELQSEINTLGNEANQAGGNMMGAQRNMSNDAAAMQNDNINLGVDQDDLNYDEGRKAYDEKHNIKTAGVDGTIAADQAKVRADSLRLATDTAAYNTASTNFTNDQTAYNDFNAAKTQVQGSLQQLETQNQGTAPTVAPNTPPSSTPASSPSSSSQDGGVQTAGKSLNAASLSGLTNPGNNSNGAQDAGNSPDSASAGVLAAQQKDQSLASGVQNAGGSLATAPTPGLTGSAAAASSSVSSPSNGYTIKAGDTFWGLENELQLSHGTLQSLNPGVDPRDLKVGETINMPGAGRSAAPNADTLHGTVVALAADTSKATADNQVNKDAGKQQALAGWGDGVQPPSSPENNVIASSTGNEGELKDAGKSGNLFSKFFG